MGKFIKYVGNPYLDRFQSNGKITTNAQRLPNLMQISLSRAAFSLIELMIALSILAIGIMAILGNYASMKSSRIAVSDETKIQSTVSSIAERLASEKFSTLGTVGSWTSGRFFDVISTDRSPLTEFSTIPLDNLISQGFELNPSGVSNLRVFIEFYRGETSFDVPGVASSKKFGLLDAGTLGGAYTAISGTGSFSARFSVPLNRTNSRLNAIPPYASLAIGDVMLIRILALWGDDGVDNDANQDGYDDNARRIEFFTARRDDSG